MSPRTGRPPIENPKSDRVTVRLTEYEQKILSECVDRFKGSSSADILRRGLAVMEVEKDNEKARELIDAMVIINESMLKGDIELARNHINQVQANFNWYLKSIKK